MHKDDARRFYLEEHQRPFKVFSRPYSIRERYRAMDQAALRRNLGEGKYESPEHYLASVGAWAAGSRGAYAAIRALVHGLLAQGFARADIERTLHLTPEELDRYRADVATTDPARVPAHDFGSDFPLQDRGKARYDQIEKERENRSA